MDGHLNMHTIESGEVRATRELFGADKSFIRTAT